MIQTIHLQTPEPRAVKKAAEVLASGGIVIYPTDTVYGIGCSVADKNAIERIHLIKRQRDDKPFSFVCSDLTHISEYAHVSNPAFKIMRRLIPGPYTFILPAARMRQLPRVLVSKRKTVGIRVPDSPVTLALVGALGHPVLSTSVTLEDGAPMGDPDLIAENFNNQVDIILDSGPLGDISSTELDLTGDAPEIIRQGAGDVSFLL